MKLPGGLGEEQILDALPMPVVLLDSEAHPQGCNAAAEHLFGRSERSFVTRGWDGLLPPDSPVLSLLRQAASAGGDVGAFDLSMAIVDSPTETVDVLAAPIDEEGGCLVVGFQRRSAAGLGERQADQREAARSAMAVAAMLAHEIKNPLSGIRGAAQLLESEDDYDNRSELSALIISEVERVRTMIDRMESFTDPTPAILEPMNIHSVLSHVRKLAQAEGIHLAEQYDPSLPEVPGDRDSLIQLFLNLIRNAREAAGPKSEITLRTAYRHGLKIGVPGRRGRIAVPIEISVIDTGPGVPPDLEGNLFDAFVTTKRGFGGLGLALAAKIASDHQGHLEYERDDRGGRSIFRLLLPMARA